MRANLPNIILIVMDTMGAKHMSLYGYQRQTTPFLDSLVDSCTVFNRCYASSGWTIPSHGSIFTGLYPSQHGAFEGNLFLSENIQQLGSALRMKGYRTLGISSNGLVSPAFGFCSDYDFFMDFSLSYLPVKQSEIKRRGQKFLGNTGEFEAYLKKGINSYEKFFLALKYVQETGHWREPLERVKKGLEHRLKHVIKPNPFYKSSLFTEKTIDLSGKIFSEHARGEKPFFLFINFMEAHEKYRPPVKHRRFARWWDRQQANMTGFFLKEKNAFFNNLLSINRNLYDDEIFYLDQKIAEIFAGLRQHGILDETVVIITSDHGEHFGEKGIYNHTLSLYNELIWVPLIIRFQPGTAPVGRDDRLTTLTDVYATVLDLAQSPLPCPTSSYSLLAERKREFALSQFIFPEKDPKLLEAIQASYKAENREFSPGIMAVVTASGKKIMEKRNGDLEIYDLAQDNDENNDLAPTLDPAIAGQFRGLMDFLKEETSYQEAFENAERSCRNMEQKSYQYEY